ncbi:helix-turn-helix transcriptional regulator [Pseudomonas zhanjiangensis]|uniref:AraC family transcriptional regulator n=1 Tax=Pseudomonas zhanjiangensis TaxID=3239015 RepID=A0ABV3YST0_9PSED
MGVEAIHRSQARRNLIALQRGEHCHDYAQVLIGWRGRMDCEFQGNAGRLGNGAAALVPASAGHLYAGLSEDSELLVIDVALQDPYIRALEQACALNFSQTLFQRPEFVCLDGAALPMLDFAAGQLRREPAPGDSVVSYQLVSLFMTQLVQLYSSAAALPLRNSRLAVDELDRLIDRRLAEPPSNAELAAAINLSESHFHCLFQRQLGITPQQYVMGRRLQRAQFLLLNSAMSLAAVADEVGFADASSFSRAYKSRFRQTPGSARAARLQVGQAPQPH